MNGRKKSKLNDLKKPMSPFFLFCAKTRNDLRNKGDDTKITAKQLSDMWDKLSKKKKKTFIDQYNEKQQEYLKKKEEIENSSQEESEEDEDEEKEKRSNTKKSDSKMKSKVKKEEIDKNNLKACNCGKCDDCKIRKKSSKNNDDTNNEKEEDKENNQKNNLIQEIIELFKKKTKKKCYTYVESISKDLDILDDKIGGKPYLPKGIEYPKTSSGENMTLLLQINLSNFKLNGFPSKGFFEIFHESSFDDYEGEYKVFLFEENLEYQTEFPEINYEEFICKQPLKLTFTEDISYMNYLDINFNSTILQCINEITKKDYQELDDFLEENKIDVNNFDDNFEQKGFHSHGLGAWPDFIQEDPRNESEKDFVNIFEFNSCEYTMFGDCGYGWILIDKDDLKNGKVENAKFGWDCS